MKNVIKKIAAIAMAFTIIGTGTTISKKVNPQANNAFIANAATYCPNHNGTRQKTWTTTIRMHYPWGVYVITQTNTATFCASCENQLTPTKSKITKRWE